METITLGNLELTTEKYLVLDTANKYMEPIPDMKYYLDVLGGGQWPNDYRGYFEVSDYKPISRLIKGKTFFIDSGPYKYSCKLTTRRGNKFYVKGQNIGHAREPSDA